RERREWDGGQPGKPAIVPFPELWEAVCQLAESCGCKPPSGLHWPWEPEKPKAGPTSGGTGRTGDPGDVEKRAIAYLVTMPEAVSERGGHDGLFAAACAMVWGFALSEDRGFEIIKTHLNLRCRPEWSDREIRHKVEDVLKVASHAHPRGHLRDKPLPESPRIVVAGKPLARGARGPPPALPRPRHPTSAPGSPHRASRGARRTAVGGGEPETTSMARQNGGVGAGGRGEERNEERGEGRGADLGDGRGRGGRGPGGTEENQKRGEEHRQPSGYRQ